MDGQFCKLIWVELVDMDAAPWFDFGLSFTAKGLLDNGLLGLMVVAGVAPVLDPGRDV